MTVEEIFSSIITHLRQGLTVHNQIATMYNFLNLKGYQKCHEYHYFEEGFNCKKLQDFYLNTYNKFMVIAAAEPIEIIPPSWYKYTKAQVDINTKRATIKQLANKWVKWEKDTKLLLETSYKQLYESGEIYAAIKISHLIQDVGKELHAAEELQINLQASGYDLPTIITEQQHIYKQYAKQIRHIYKDDDE